MTFELGPNQRAWIDALLSGDYKQTDAGYLHVIGAEGEPDEMCCLGVLCHIESRKGFLNAKNNTQSYYDNTIEGVGKHITVKGYVDANASTDYPYYEKQELPYVTQQKYGFVSESGSFIDTDNEGTATDGDNNNCLAEMNDNGKSFEEIATFILNNPAKVFRHAY